MKITLHYLFTEIDSPEINPDCKGEIQKREARKLGLRLWLQGIDGFQAILKEIDDPRLAACIVQVCRQDREESNW